MYENKLLETRSSSEVGILHPVWNACHTYRYLLGVFPAYSYGIWLRGNGLHDKETLVINFGDYIQLCTIYIKQKPDND